MISPPLRDQENGEILQTLLDESRPREITSYLRSLSAVERSSLVSHLKRLEQEKKSRGPVIALKSCSGLILAGAGIFESTPELSVWIEMYGRDLRDNNGNSIIQLIVDMLCMRDRVWRSRLVRRLACLRSLSPDQVALILAVVGTSGGELPVTDRLVLGWVKANCRLAPKAIAPECMRLVSRIFAVRGTGRFLINRCGDGLTTAIAVAAHSPRIRAELLDSCLSAIGHPGSTADLRGYLAAYHALAPKLGEVELRLQRYVKFLGENQRSVAQLAQHELFRLHRSDRIRTEIWLRLTRTAFQHPDRSTVLVQLGQLTRVLTKEPSAVESGMHSLLSALTHHDREVVGCAQRVAGQFAQEASIRTRELLATAYHGSVARGHRESRV